MRSDKTKQIDAIAFELERAYHAWNEEHFKVTEGKKNPERLWELTKVCDRLEMRLEEIRRLPE